MPPLTLLDRLEDIQRQGEVSGEQRLLVQQEMFVQPLVSLEQREEARRRRLLQGDVDDSPQFLEEALYSNAPAFGKAPDGFARGTRSP